MTGFIPYTYCLPEQRCAEDLVTHSTDQSETKHTKHHSKHTDKQGKPLTRRSSKSLPDISDLHKATASKEMRYPSDSTNTHTAPQDRDEDDNTYGMSMKRQSRSMKRSMQPRARPVSQDMTSSGGIRPSSARSSHSQPTSPVRSYNRGMSGSLSNPGTPRATNSYLKAHNRNSGNGYNNKASDLMQQSWNPTSGQSLMKYMSTNNPANLSSSYPVNGRHSNNRYSGSYQHSLASTNTQVSEQPLKPGKNSVSGDTHINNGIIASGNKIAVKAQQLQMPLVETFKKTVMGEYMVLFTFKPHQENDIEVEKGEFVIVLNTDDKDWFWVKKANKQEGFVPGTYLMKLEKHCK